MKDSCWKKSIWDC